MADALRYQVFLGERRLSLPVLVEKLHTGQIVDLLRQGVEGLGPALGK